MLHACDMLAIIAPQEAFRKLDDELGSLKQRAVHVQSTIAAKVRLVRRLQALQQVGPSYSCVTDQVVIEHILVVALPGNIY